MEVNKTEWIPFFNINQIANPINPIAINLVSFEILSPKKIIRSNNVTVVFWKDGSKTIVRCQNDDLDDDYTAFCAALGKKVFGSNSALKKVIKKCLTVQSKTKYRMKREQEAQEVAKLKEDMA